MRKACACNRGGAQWTGCKCPSSSIPHVQAYTVDDDDDDLPIAYAIRVERTEPIMTAANVLRGFLPPPFTFGAPLPPATLHPGFGAPGGMDSKRLEKKRKMEDSPCAEEEAAAAAERKAERKKALAAQRQAAAARMEAAAAARMEAGKNAKFSNARVPAGLLGPIVGHEIYRVSLQQGDTVLSTAVMQVAERHYDPSRMVMISMEKIVK